jgi:tetratricopeptide (TPR) repeat protein
MSKEEPNGAKKITSEPAQTTAAEQTAKPEAVTTEAASTPTPANQQSAKPADEVEKLRRDQYELRDRINNLRENELFTLREKISRLNLYIVTVAAVIGVLGFMGVKSYFDLENLIKTRIDEQTKTSLAFNEKYVRASAFVQGGDHSNAIPIYQELYQQKPEEEVLFYALLNSLNMVNKYEEAMPVIELARSKGFLPDRYKNSSSFNNAAHFLLIKSVDTPNLKDEAFQYLQKAKALATGPGELQSPYFNLAVYYATYGTPEQAKDYGQLYRTTLPAEWQWHPENEGPWLKRLEKVQPNIRAVLEKALAK